MRLLACWLVSSSGSRSQSSLTCAVTTLCMLAPLQEKRKRSQGQATKGKNFVEEEKRLQVRGCVCFVLLHSSGVFSR